MTPDGSQQLEDLLLCCRACLCKDATSQIIDVSAAHSLFGVSRVMKNSPSCKQSLFRIVAEPQTARLMPFYNVWPKQVLESVCSGYP